MILRENSASDKNIDVTESEQDFTQTADIGKKFGNFEKTFYEFKMNIEKKLMNLSEELILNRTQSLKVYEQNFFLLSKKDKKKEPFFFLYIFLNYTNNLTLLIKI